MSESKSLMSRLAVASCHAPKSNTLSNTYSSLYFLWFFFFNLHSQIFSGVWKEPSAGIITFGEVSNFQEKKIQIHQRTHLILALVCMPHLVLAPRGLRARSKSVESRTKTVSSDVTLSQLQVALLHSLAISTANTSKLNNLWASSRTKVFFNVMKSTNCNLNAPIFIQNGRFHYQYKAVIAHVT